MTWRAINRADLAIEGRSITAGIPRDLIANRNYFRDTRGMQTHTFYPVGQAPPGWSPAPGETYAWEDILGTYRTVKGTPTVDATVQGLSFSTLLWKPLSVVIPIQVPINARFVDVYIRSTSIGESSSVFGSIIGARQYESSEFIEQVPNTFGVRNWNSEVTASDAYATIPQFGGSGNIPITRITIPLTEYFSALALDQAYQGYNYNNSTNPVFVSLNFLSGISSTTTTTLTAERYAPLVDPRTFVCLSSSLPSTNPGPWPFALRVQGGITYNGTTWTDGYFPIIQRTYQRETKGGSPVNANYLVLHPTPTNDELQRFFIEASIAESSLTFHRLSTINLYSVHTHTRAA